MKEIIETLVNKWWQSEQTQMVPLDSDAFKEELFNLLPQYTFTIANDQWIIL